jgi:hypothetical protein
LNEVRPGINRAQPPGYKEGIPFGMMSWFVPLTTYLAGYGGNKKVALLPSPWRQRNRRERQFSV